MTTETAEKKEKLDLKDQQLNDLFEVGAHYAFSRSRRHPSMAKHIYGQKNKVEIINLENTKELLASAIEYLSEIVKSKKQVLFVSGKSEFKDLIEYMGSSSDMPFVAGRWVGGTFTNFTEINKRAARLESLKQKKEVGDLKMYTKKERLLIDREIEKLETLFGGLSKMKSLPAALFVIDTKKEHIAVEEAKEKGIPVVALMGSDCDLSDAKYPIVANDSSISSVKYFVEKIVEAIKKVQ